MIAKKLTGGIRIILAFIFMIVPLPAQAGEHDKPLAELPVHGEWDAQYYDQNLGLVQGYATVDEAAGSAQIVYLHPKTGKKFQLTSTSFNRNGDKITIVFEGQSPVLYRDDGQGYPQRHLIVPEDTGEVIVKAGANEAKIKLSPRRDSDQERIELELSIKDESTLAGTWRYRADPFTRRARDGLGRAGKFVLQEDGTGLQQGNESWSRHAEPVVLGAFALQPQTGYGKYSDEPNYPHPYQNDEFQGKQTFRTIFIFGTDLPDGKSNRALITSEIEGVSYKQVHYPDSPFLFSRGFLKPFETGKAKLLKQFERKMPAAIAQATIKAFDYLVVEATLSEGVRPGLQPFSVNGSENTWILMFGNNRADVRFVREIDPDAIPSEKKDVFGYTIKHTDQKVTRGILTIEIYDDALAGDSKLAVVKPGQSISGDINKIKTHTELPDTIERIRRWGLFPRWDAKNVEKSPIITDPRTQKGRYGTLVLKRDGSFSYKANKVRVDSERFELTGDAYIPETLQVEVRTELDLDLDVIDVTIGKNGDVQKMGPSKLVAAYRVTGDRRLYRTGKISVVSPQMGGNKPSAMFDPSQGLRHNLPTLRYFLPVEHDDVLYTSIASAPRLISIMPPKAVLAVHATPARFPRQLSYLWKDHLKNAAACYPELKDIDWNRSSANFVAEVERSLHFEWWKLVSPITLAFSSETLTVDFQLGDHAAMLLMRQTFNQMMIQKIYELNRAAASDQEMRAFFVMMNPYRWNPREHPITQVGFDIQVTGPRGQQMSFLDTFWGGDGKSRTYDNLDEMPKWIVQATREAVLAYIRIMEKSLDFSQKIEACNVKGLVMLTGNTFENVQKWLTPRLMRLDATSSAMSQAWAADYHARLRVKLVASRFFEVKAHAKIADQDTQHLVMATAIISMPIIIAGGWPAAIIVGISEIALEGAVELPKVLESRSEIAFARGTVHVLGDGRYDQAKADEYTFNELLLKLAISAALEVGGGPALESMAAVAAAPVKFALWAGKKGLKASVPALKKSLFSFQVGVRYVLARRGQEIFKRYDFDVTKLPANLKPRDYKAMMEYVFKAGRLRAANGLLDDDQIKVLLRLEELQGIAKTKPRWARNFDEATHNDIKNLYFRKDIKKLMTTAGDAVTTALRTGGRTREEALSILRYGPQTTGEHFQRTLQWRLKIKREPLGLDAFTMTAATNREVAGLLDKNMWLIKYPHYKGIFHFIKMHAPGIKKPDEMMRGFDPATNTLILKSAFRKRIPTHINVGLPYNLSEKGFPAYLFAQLRYMNMVGIGYAGQEGILLKKVVMDFVVNARTNAQLAWFRKTYHPTRSFEQLQNEGLLGEFLLHTRSVDYARSILNMAGYRVKAVRMDLYGPEGRIGDLEQFFKMAKDGETWKPYLKRHGLSANEKGAPRFDIHIEVEPHHNAIKKAAANDNLPGPQGGGGSTPPGGSGGAGGGGGSTPPGDSGAAGSGEPDYMQTLRRLRQEMDKRSGIAKNRFVKGVQDGTELMPQTANEFEAIAKSDLDLETLESAVKAARRMGVSDDFIARRIADYELFQTPADRIRQINQLNTLTRSKEGIDILLPRVEAGEIVILLGRVRAGTSTPEDLNALRNMFQRSADEGRNFIDDLARTHVNMPGDTSEPLANAFTLRRLRDLAGRENLHPAGTGTSGSSAPAPPRSISDQVAQRLANLAQGEREARSLSAEMLVSMGVPDDFAANFAVESSRSLIGTEGGSAISLLRQAIFLAEGIMLHGSRRVDIKEVARVSGLPRRVVEVGAQVAALERGLAVLPDEIRPAKFYPPL